MTARESKPESQPGESPRRDIHPEAAGLYGLRTWNGVYVFVVAVFILWVALLHLLTRTFS